MNELEEIKQLRNQHIGKLYLTPFESFIVEERVSGKTMVEIVEGFNQKFNKKITVRILGTWFQKEGVQKELLNRLEEKMAASNWSGDKIVNELGMIALSRRNKKEMNGQEVSALKLIAQLRNHLDKESGNTNVSIQLTQGDGRL